MHSRSQQDARSFTHLQREATFLSLMNRGQIKVSFAWGLVGTVTNTMQKAITGWHADQDQITIETNATPFDYGHDIRDF